MRDRKKKNLPLIDSSEKVVNDLIRTDQLRVGRGEANPRLVTDMKRILKKDILPYFKNTDIKQINHQKLVDYTEHLRADKERNVGSNTIKIHFVNIRKILKHAHKMRIPSRPGNAQPIGGEMRWNPDATNSRALVQNARRGARGCKSRDDLAVSIEPSRYGPEAESGT